MGDQVSRRKFIVTTTPPAGWPSRVGQERRRLPWRKAGSGQGICPGCRSRPQPRNWSEKAASAGWYRAGGRRVRRGHKIKQVLRGNRQRNHRC